MEYKYLSFSLVQKWKLFKFVRLIAKNLCAMIITRSVNASFTNSKNHSKSTYKEQSESSIKVASLFSEKWKNVRINRHSKCTYFYKVPCIYFSIYLNLPYVLEIYLVFFFFLTYLFIQAVWRVDMYTFDKNNKSIL